MGAITSSEMGFPVNHWALSLAWATSIHRPFTAVSPRRSASRRIWVRAGLYMASSTPSNPGNWPRSRGLTPVLGYIPTGVALTITAASAWRERFR